jgi:nickel transport protein
MQRLVLLPSLAVLIVSLSAQGASAHTTTVFAHAHGKEIHGDVTADGDTPMAGAKITAYSPSGEILAETVADAKGQFTLTVTQRCDWRIVASGGGHHASYTVPMDELPPDLPAASGATHSDSHDDEHAHVAEPGETDEDNAELRRQVIALRNDIRDLREKLRWQDVIGGIGYILGLMGVACYFLGTHRGERFPSKTGD